MLGVKNLPACLHRGGRSAGIRSACIRWNSSTSAAVDSNTKKYAKTMILPQTSFPGRTNPAVLEPELQKLMCDKLYDWNIKRTPVMENGVGKSHCTPFSFMAVFTVVFLSTCAEKQYVLHDGPPYANGKLHIGHFLNKVLKDINNRFQVHIFNLPPAH
jgi:isoleucyl-tRNA synthetase